jgi:hypothetical protein
LASNTQRWLGRCSTNLNGPFPTGLLVLNGWLCMADGAVPSRMCLGTGENERHGSMKSACGRIPILMVNESTTVASR